MLLKIRYFIVTYVMLFTYDLSAQTSKLSKFTFYGNVIPCAYLYGERGDGFQAGLGYDLNRKYKVLLSYGMSKRTYELSDQVPPVTINGTRIVDLMTEASIFTPNDMRIGVTDKSKYELLEAAGIKHYEPRDGAYVTNYFSTEVIRKHAFKNKLDLEWGFGGQLGIMNRNEVGGGVSEVLNFVEPPVKTWIVFRISARYIYYGFTGRVTLTKKLSDHFSVGLSSGFHIIMGKENLDTFNPYLGVVAVCRI